MGRASLGAFGSKPLGIVAAKSKLALTRTLFDHRQPGFSRPVAQQAPDEVMRRHGMALTDTPGSGKTTARRNYRNTFSGGVTVEERESALLTAKARRKGWNALWADGPRLGNGRVGAAVVWREGEG